MAIKGRLRFEILRRDGHTCRYCGGSSPDVKLTIDHVVPQSLGGTDDPTNLVTACTSCNAGKASIAPDSATVDDVASDALRYSQALTRAIAERAERFELLAESIDAFDAAWSAWGRGSGDDRVLVPRAADWSNTVERWLVGGVGVEELIHKIPRAMNDKIKFDSKWTYFCGIGWGTLTDLQDRARELANLSDKDGEESDDSIGCCTICTVSITADEMVCGPCAFDAGWRKGTDAAEEYHRSPAQEERVYLRLLRERDGFPEIRYSENVQAYV